MLTTVIMLTSIVQRMLFMSYFGLERRWRKQHQNVKKKKKCPQKLVNSAQIYKLLNLFEQVATLVETSKYILNSLSTASNRQKVTKYYRLYLTLGNGLKFKLKLETLTFSLKIFLFTLYYCFSNLSRYNLNKYNMNRKSMTKYHII